MAKSPLLYGLLIIVLTNSPKIHFFDQAGFLIHYMKQIFTCWPELPGSAFITVMQVDSIFINQLVFVIGNDDSKPAGNKICMVIM